jgi:hypothetical protein
MNPDLWTMAMHIAKTQALEEARREGVRIASLDPATRSKMAKLKLIQECEEWLARNRP